MTRWPARLAPPVFAADTQARTFWQSRAGLREPPPLADLPALARAVRASHEATTHEPESPGVEEAANEIPDGS